MIGDNQILFEYPLNEKMRGWLRVENLLLQVFTSPIPTFNQDPLQLFRALGELLETFERGDVRSELLRELERQQQKLQQWLNYPGADIEIIQQLMGRFSHATTILTQAPRNGQLLRDDKLIAQVRQRLMIPGGCCNFDLPTLHFWLHLPFERRSQDVERWRASLIPIQQSLILLLQLIRDSCQFQPQTAINGFFQDSAEQTELLRLILDSELEIYPQVSGHKNRYAIRFISFNHESESIPTQLNFQLAYG